MQVLTNALILDIVLCMLQNCFIILAWTKCEDFNSNMCEIIRENYLVLKILEFFEPEQLNE